MRQIPGTPFAVAVEGADTGGRAVVLTAAMPPGLRVDAHVHYTEEQINVVISGRVHFRVGTETCDLGPGGILLMPRGVEHELWNEGPEFAELVEIYTPPGMEQKFAAAGAAAVARGDTFANPDDFAAARSLS
jgi:mannose-6-phosphate isomerase-like protein (cupin superfamily)